jgi:hypothetical protein
MQESGIEDVFWVPGVCKTVAAVLREADRRAPKLSNPPPPIALWAPFPFNIFANGSSLLQVYIKINHVRAS